jgi:hypothetical protein
VLPLKCALWHNRVADAHINVVNSRDEVDLTTLGLPSHNSAPVSLNLYAIFVRLDFKISFYSFENDTLLKYTDLCTTKETLFSNYVAGGPKKCKIYETSNIDWQNATDLVDINFSNFYTL